jgi:hypothetical protein
MSEYTKGPWKLETYSDSKVKDAMRIRASDTLVIVPEVWGASLAQCDANYNLIAAAPDLLEALQLLQQAIYNARLLDVKKQFDLCVADSAASKAIAKAIGKDVQS